MFNNFNFETLVFNKAFLLSFFQLLNSCDRHPLAISKNIKIKNSHVKEGVKTITLLFTDKFLYKRGGETPVKYKLEKIDVICYNVGFHFFPYTTYFHI